MKHHLSFFRPLLLLGTCLLLFSFALTACNQRKAPLMSDLDFSPVDPAACTETTEVTELVRITVTGYGDILVRLFPETAPETVKNFQTLVSEHFYDGLTFHRIVEGFMIQGGDPKGDGTGGSTQTIHGEFSANHFENNLRHIRGVVSMARSSLSMDSASSQFFIMHATASSLDGQYAAFGYVVSGMDTVDAIAQAAVTTNSSGENSKPTKKIEIAKIVFVKAGA